MSRSLKKAPYVDEKLLMKVQKLSPTDKTVIKTWARIERGKQTDWDDYPPEKVAFFMRTPAWCRRRAAEPQSTDERRG